MHAVTVLLGLALVLHLAGFLLPLLYGIGVVISIGLVWGIIRIVSSILNSVGNSVDLSEGSLGYSHPQPKGGHTRFRPAIQGSPKESVGTEKNELTHQHSPTYGRLITAPTSGLIIKAEPLEKILNGSKIWEMRSLTTKKRGPIALIGKGSQQILGIAEIIDVRGPLSKATISQTENLHQISASRLDDPEVVNLSYAWVLSNVRRLNPPVPYTPRNGAVRFVNLTSSEVAAIQAQM